MTHVNDWRKAEAIERYTERARKEENLLSLWFERKWQTTFCGRKIVGELKEVNNYGSMGEPTFTIEFPDPDYPSGDVLTLTAHYSRFEAK